MVSISTIKQNPVYICLPGTKYLIHIQFFEIVQALAKNISPQNTTKPELFTVQQHQTAETRIVTVF